MMRRVTVTIPDAIEADLDRFLAFHDPPPPVSSVLRTALRQYLASAARVDKGRLITRVFANRAAIREIAARRRIRSVRLFGSVAKGEDGPDSDIDFLVTPDTGCTLFDVAGLQGELTDLLEAEVDVVTDGAVPADMRDRLQSESIPL